MKKLSYLIILIFLSASVSLLAESPKKVFVEEYSSAYCGTCGVFAPTYYQVGNQYANDIIPVVIATGNGPGDPFYKHDPDNSSRVGLYLSGGYGTPAVWVDGEKVPFQNYQSTISSYTGGMSPITIYPIENREENGLLKIKTIVQSDEALNNGEQLFVFIVEEDIYHPNAGSNNQKDFHWMTREILPYSTSGVPLNIDAGGLQTYETQIEIRDDWDMEKIYLVAIVQRTSGDKEVLQAAKTLQDLSIIVPNITANYSKVDFGDIADLAEETVVITNTGLDDLTISDISLSNTDDAVFSIKSSGSNVLKPGETNEIVIEFFPKENGDYENELVIVSDADNKSTLKIDLEGKATNIVPFGEITYDVDNIDFGDVSTSKTIEWQFTNTGTGPLTISSILIPEIDNPDEVYKIDLESTENIVVQPNEMFSIPIIFSPLADNQFYFADMIINSDAKNNSELYVILRGRGMDVSTDPEITVLIDGEEASTLDFGDITSGDKTQLTLELNNSGRGNLDVTGLYILPDGDLDHNQFAVESRTAFSLPAGETENIMISFQALETKEYRAKLRVVSDQLDDFMVSLVAQADVTGIYGNYLIENGILEVSINPNPVISSGNISFNFNADNAEKMRISVCDLNGNNIENLFDKTITNGNYNIEINSEKYINGTYFIIFETMNHKHVEQLKIMN